MFLQGVKKNIVLRPVKRKTLLQNDIDPVLARVYASRGIERPEQLERSLSRLPPPELLSGMGDMVSQLYEAIKSRQKLCIVADFDADGATSCALAMRGLKLLGADNVSFIVPNRFEYGYGLTTEIVELVKAQQADVIITVDNGIGSIDGVAAANEAGIKVLITDHHLPGETLPDAAAIVNPNLEDDRFPSGNIAGVGVIFYVLMALRRYLRKQDWFVQQQLAEPNLAQLLDLVALGTVADVVMLDEVNRILVYQGLQRIRSGQCCPGIKALIEVAGRQLARMQPSDLGFAIGPRLNAAGRMDDMSLGIQCLLTDDAEIAKDAARQLDDLNQERKEIEAQMKQNAMQLLSEMKAFDEKHLPAGVCLYNQAWHQGVIGILASRIKERLHRPVVAFAPAEDGQIKGSARSIEGVHIRDVLCEVATRHPDILSRFGGHAMAAGMTIALHDYPPFALAFDEVVSEKLADMDLAQKVYSDGELDQTYLNIAFAEQLQQAATWGQGFPEPIFHGHFDVIQCRIVGQQHVKFVLQLEGASLLIDAIAFFVEQPENWLGSRKILAAYKLDINEYQGNRSVQLILNYAEKLN
jgi:single-stranded-DNA-specific exonuclease